MSCERDKGVNSFNVDLEITDLICYPQDLISLTFRLNSSNGQAPYRYEWLNPDSLVGEGPFKIDLTHNLYLRVDVTDTNSIKVNFEHRIIRDTIDCLKNDYRNAFVGLYKCDVTACSVNTDTWIQTCNEYIDTIEIAKHEDFSVLQTIGRPYARFQFKLSDSSFTGYRGNRVYGRFFTNGIYLYSYVSPVALSSSTYRGVKINP